MNDQQADQSIFEKRLKDTYHCGITGLLHAAYGRTFTKLQCGKCKWKYPDALVWFATLSEEQQASVRKFIDESF